jgi:hypothetical protein
MWFQFVQSSSFVKPLFLDSFVTSSQLLIFIMRNCICQNHIILQLKLKKNSYAIVMQLSLGYYNYGATIPLEIQRINK